jgi:hypothetical protein
MGIYDTMQNFVQGLVWGGIDDNERAKMMSASVSIARVFSPAD